MTLLDLFKRRGSAPVARERLQVLLAYERKNRNQPDLVAILREEIMAVITRHIHVDQDDVHISMDRGVRMSTLEIDIHIPNAGAIAHRWSRRSASQSTSQPGRSRPWWASSP